MDLVKILGDLQKACKICGDENPIGSYCESCEINGQEICLKYEGNISKDRIEEILMLRLGR